MGWKLKDGGSIPNNKYTIAVVHKIDLKANKITGNKEVHSMFFKGSIYSR